MKSRKTNGTFSSINEGCPTDKSVKYEGCESSNKIDLFSVGVLNSLSAHIAVLDIDGNIIAINNAWKKFSVENGGDARSVCTGSNYFKTCMDAINNDGVHEAKAAIAGINKVLKGELSEYELEYSCHSPEEKRWFLMRTTPLYFRGNKAVVSHINITDKKLVEESLIEREKELLALHTISRSVNVSLSLETVINKIIEQITTTVHPDLTLLFIKEGDMLLLKGLSPKKQRFEHEMKQIHRVGQCLCGISVSSGNAIYSENIHHDKRCTWDECKKAGITSFAAVPLICKNKIIGTLGLASIIMRNFKKRHLFLEAIANDAALFLHNSLLYKKSETYAHDLKLQLSERKKMEASLIKAQKMEAIGNLAGGVAHDFNNLLFPIIGMSELLMDDLPKGSPSHKKVQEILKAGKRCSDLVKQILAFSRQSETIEMPVRIQQILIEVLRLSRSAIPSDIEISQDIQIDCGLVMANPTQIHQIAMNLMTNAYHAVSLTGGKIIVHLKETVLEADDLVGSPLQPGKYAMLRITDTGCGIDPAIIDKIFDPYFTTKEKGKGTGLGLAVVYGIVKGHSGAVHVDSELGKGTTFTIYIPLMKQRLQVGSVEMAEILPIGKEHILLVDDEESIAKLQKQMLERLGYQVTSLTRSLDAFDAFRANPDAYDIVITDMTMPNMTGDQLAKELISIKPDLPVIICTGFSDRIDEEKAYSMGIRGFLMKPIVRSEMAKIIRKVLDESNTTDS